MKVFRKLLCCSGNDGRTQLHDPKSVEKAQRMLADGADPNERDNQGRTPLFNPVNKEYAKILLNAGADPNARDHEGMTPLHVAKTGEVVSVLLQFGANPNGRDNYKNTPLHDALNAEVAVALLHAGADPNARNGWEQTPLLVTGLTGPVEVVNTLLEFGADPNAMSRKGTTPLKGLMPFFLPSPKGLVFPRHVEKKFFVLLDGGAKLPTDTWRDNHYVQNWAHDRYRAYLAFQKILRENEDYSDGLITEMLDFAFDHKLILGLQLIR